MNFKEQLLNEWNKLKEENADATAWDAFISLVDGKVPKYVLYLRADIEIIRYIAEGNTVLSIHRMTGIPSKIIREIVNLWGLEPLDTALDFNPLLVYNSGMTAEEMERKVNSMLPIPISIGEYRKIIHNIQKYHDFLNALELEEK